MKAPARQLWRLDAAEPHLLPPEAQALADGLRLHVQNTAIDSVLVRIGTAEQSYIVTTGCAGCAWGRCELGCAVEMLRRLLRRHAPGVDIKPFPGGLSARPYTRAVMASPAKEAQVRGDFLHLWPEARLVVRWCAGRHQRVQTSALLLVGAEGPSPGSVLREHGWQPWPVLTTFGRRWAGAPVPPVLPLTRPYRNAPTLLFPTRQPRVCPPVAVPSRDAGLDTQLTTWLTSVLAHPHQLAEEAPTPPQDTPPSPWPAGPGTLAPTALGTLVEQLIAEPSFQSTRKGQSGLSKGRLAGLKYPGLSENVARALMVWFDRAGVLAQPEDGQGLWRAPRPFALSGLEQIAAKLRDAPLPTNEEIRAAYGGEA